jgi:hypothetical protein
MVRFFPDADRVREARQRLANGHFGELDALMGVSSLTTPYEARPKEIIDEFCELASSLGLSDQCADGFVVLVPVTVNGSTHTTPVLVDVASCELSFTSHPELGAGVIADGVLVANPRLIVDVRDALLGVLATWHNAELTPQ